MKKLVAFAGFSLLAVGAFAQTNLQVFYDFGKDRKYITTTLEMFKADDWGNTFFFVDYNYTNKDQRDLGQRGVTFTYMEIERGLNFWKESSLADLSAHVEFQASPYTCNWLFGAQYFLHNTDFSNTLTLYAMYKYFRTENSSDIPFQLSAVWGMQDIFGVEGLRFSGFADFWGENASWNAGADKTKFMFLTEPQIWYNAGKFFNCPNFNVGGEVELSCNFAGNKGFMCNPCLGVKWNF